MKPFGRIALGLMLCALMVLLAPSLIRDGTEAAAEDTGAPKSAGMSVLLAVANEPVRDTAAASPVRSPEAPRSQAIVMRADVPTVDAAHDGNGWILRSRPWVREAYAACPPQKQPGG